MATDAAYLALKSVHVLAASLFLGFWVFALWWKTSTDRTRDARAIAAMSDRLLAADRSFVGWLGLVTFASGYVIVRPLGYYGGRIASAPFALYGLFLLFGSLALWYFALRPLEIRMADAADAAVAAKAGPSEDYARASGTWVLLASLVIALVVVTAVLMVVKPGS